MDLGVDRGLGCRAGPRCSLCFLPKPGWAVLMFPDASDEHWWRFLTQVPQGVLDRGVPVEDMTHEPLGFVNVTLKGPEQRWDTMDTKGFPMVSAFKRLEYHLWNGEHIYTNHRNLVYIFDPKACVLSVAKATAQHWSAVLGAVRLYCHAHRWRP